MSIRLFRAFIMVALGTVATLSSGCSNNIGSASKSDAGSIGLALQLASGATLNSVSYTITGPSGFYAHRHDRHEPQHDGLGGHRRPPRGQRLFDRARRDDDGRRHALRGRGDVRRGRAHDDGRLGAPHVSRAAPHGLGARERHAQRLPDGGRHLGVAGGGLRRLVARAHRGRRTTATADPPRSPITGRRRAARSARPTFRTHR